MHKPIIRYATKGLSLILQKSNAYNAAIKTANTLKYPGDNEIFE